MIRINANKTIEEIDEEIDQCVNQLKLLINDSIKEWRIINNPVEEVIRSGRISVDDKIEFRTIQELCRCFGRENKPIQRCYFDIGNGYQIWCPKLAIYEAGRAKAGSSAGWINLLSEDKETIYESHPEKKKIENMHYTQNNPRIVFAKSKSVLGIDAYRFLGVYKYQNTENGIRVYKRIKKELDIREFFINL